MASMLEMPEKIESSQEETTNESQSLKRSIYDDKGIFTFKNLVIVVVVLVLLYFALKYLKPLLMGGNTAT